mmetsp:Transcript_6207/g.5638  ORF Transcript_6207/g.5638 Transcript_6207/m.5638 type:complete len:226 (+) Transcript_6207:1013-1690(+)
MPQNEYYGVTLSVKTVHTAGFTYTITVPAGASVLVTRINWFATNRTTVELIKKTIALPAGETQATLNVPTNDLNNPRAFAGIVGFVAQNTGSNIHFESEITDLANDHVTIGIESNSGNVKYVEVILISFEETGYQAILPTISTTENGPLSSGKGDREETQTDIMGPKGRNYVNFFAFTKLDIGLSSKPRIYEIALENENKVQRIFSTRYSSVVNAAAGQTFIAHN